MPRAEEGKEMGGKRGRMGREGKEKRIISGERGKERKRRRMCGCFYI